MVNLTITLGILITFLSSFCVFFNLLMLIILWKGGFLKAKYGGIYLLAFAQIAGWMITPFLAAIYLGPSVIAQDTFFEQLEGVPRFIGFSFHAQWISDLLLQVVTAVNRWLVIVHPEMSSFFTRNKTIAYIFIVYVIGVIIGFISSYLMPCCPMYLHYKIFSAGYIGSNFNISEYSLNLPFNAVCSLTAIFCYWRIYVHINKSNTQISRILHEEDNQSRKIRQTRLALQFAICTGFCIVGWIGFRIGPMVVTFSPEMYMVVTCAELIHCISASLIFLIFNHDIRQKLKFSDVELSYSKKSPNDISHTQASGQA